VATWVEFLNDLATQADAIALRYFRTDLQVDRKSDLSPVTQADREIEDLATRLLRERHPELGMLGEESGEHGPSEAGRLIIDPIDGTRNFVRGIPIFATLLAIEIAGEVVAGLVSAPALGMRWHAVRGGGAFRDGRPIRVSEVADLDHALLFHANLGQAEPPPPPGFFDLVGDVERTRGFGDFYQHVLVAEGAGEMALDPEAHPWDIAALQVIVEEAGGQATTLGGERSIYGGSLVTSNGELHRSVLSALGVRGLDGGPPRRATL
jgi:histidinol-phosphatase